MQARSITVTVEIVEEETPEKPVEWNWIGKKEARRVCRACDRFFRSRHIPIISYQSGINFMSATKAKRKEAE